MYNNDLVISEDKFFETRGNIYTIYDQRKIPLELNFVQDKISKSNQGVIRGFHGDDKTWKLITCLQGKVKLVTYNVDTDEKNVYFLDGDKEIMDSVLVPPRVLNAHQCLSQNCTFFYKWSEFYTSPEDQWSVNYNDPGINPEWDDKFCKIVSDRDQNSQSLKELKENVK
jgi:dTDP-4-dehydrorhamnose 3,5-epimerase